MTIEMTDEIRRRFERMAEFRRGWGIINESIGKETEAFVEWRDNVYDPDGIIYPFDPNHPSYHDYEIREARSQKAGEDWEKYKKEHYPYGFDENGPII